MRRFIIGTLLAMLLALFAVAIKAVAENTLYGTGAGQNITSVGLDNTIIGNNAATQLTIGRGNTLLGTYAGYLGYGTTGTVKLGYLAGNADTTSHKLFLTTGYYPAKGIFGNFSTGYFGVNTAAPTAAWHVTGVAKSDTVQTANFVATGYGIINGATILRGGMAITGAVSADTTKGTNAAFTGYGIVNGALIARTSATFGGTNSSTATFDSKGRYLALGDSAYEYDEIFVKPTGVYRNPATPTVPDFGVWLFPGHTFLLDAAAPESLFFNVEIPHKALTGGALDAHVHWAPTSTNTGKVAWKLAWMIKDIGGTFAFSAGDTLSGQTAGGGTTNAHQYTDLGDISTAAITGVSAIMFGVLIRDADKGSDGYTGDAAFLDLGFHYKVDSFGSRWETKK